MFDVLDWERKGKASFKVAKVVVLRSEVPKAVSGGLDMM